MYGFPFLLTILRPPVFHHVMGYKESLNSLFTVAPFKESCLFSSKTSNLEWIQYIKDPKLPREEKIFLNIKRRMGTTMERMQRRNLCNYCWLHPNLCMCGAFKPRSACHFRFKIHILMHAREFAKLSNSGRIIAGFFDAPLYIGWNEVSKKSLDTLFAECSSENLFVLFPDKESISIEQMLSVTGPLCMDSNEIKNVESGEQAPTMGKLIHIIIIDSTWNEAKALQALVPRQFPRVALDPNLVSNYHSLLAAVRSRTRESGVCTADAVMIFLRAIGCPEKHVCQISENLNHLVNIIKLEKHTEYDRDDIPSELRQKFVQSLSGRS